MYENIKEFLKIISADEELQAKMQKAQNIDEAYSLATSVKDGYTKEEFLEVMQKLQAAAQYGELDDKDLLAAAGGGNPTAISSGSSVVTVSIAAILGAV